MSTIWVYKANQLQQQPNNDNNSNKIDTFLWFIFGHLIWISVFLGKIWTAKSMISKVCSVDHW